MTYFTQDILDQVRTFLEGQDFEPITDDELETYLYRMDVGMKTTIADGGNVSDMDRALYDMVFKEFRAPVDIQEQAFDLRDKLILEKAGDSQ